jgi:microcin C transport system substrate-binding protein
MRSLFILLAFLCSGSAWAGHAYAQFGDIKYALNFKNFDYANPLAPKGGELVMVPPSRLTSFDKYNPFTLKGNAAPGLMGLLFESLLKSLITPIAACCDAGEASKYPVT